MVLIAREDAKGRIEAGALTVLDVRPEKIFAVCHIVGAHNFPLKSVVEGVGKAGLAVAEPYLVCGRNEAESQEAAEALRQAGFQQVFVLEGGFHGWVADRLPCEPPPCGYACSVCSYGYYPQRGDGNRKIEPGTLFEELPAFWRCPWCGAEKSRFFKEV